MLLVVSGVPLQLKKTSCSGSPAAILTSRSRSTAAVNDGTDTVRVDFWVLGWGCRWVGFPDAETIVPEIRTVASNLVTSTSHLRMASTSPIRAEVPSMSHQISNAFRLEIKDLQPEIRSGGSVWADSVWADRIWTCDPLKMSCHLVALG
jgi:hypothetical protein